MDTAEREHAALALALDEVEAQVRKEPAHRLKDLRRDYGWSLTSPSGDGVHVELERREGSEAVAVAELYATTGSFFKPTTETRRLELSLSGDAARVPDLLYLVFEKRGSVLAFESLAEAGDALDLGDVVEGLLVAAFSDQGEVIELEAGDGNVRLIATRREDADRLRELMLSSTGPRDLTDPHQFALYVWRNS